VDGARAPGRAGAVRICRHRLRVPDLLVRRQRFFRALCRVAFEFPVAPFLSDRRGVGRARRFAFVVDVDAHAVDRGRGRLQPPPARRICGTRAGRDGAGGHRFPGFHAVHFQSVRAAAARRTRWARSQSAAAGSGHGDPPAHALHGLRRFLGLVRVRHRRAAPRAARCDLGALVAPVDHCGVDLSHARHHARQRLGLLRTRLGRLVVLGPGRESLSR